MDSRMYERTHLLVPEETRSLRVLVVGAGMVGSWATAALARMVKEVTVVDYDTVESVNVGVQAYTPADVGLRKVDAMVLHSRQLPVKPLWACIPAGPLESGDMDFDDGEFGEPDLEAPPVLADVSGYDVIVSAVDSMAGRKWLVEQMHGMSTGRRLFVDVRVQGEMVCVLTVKQDSVWDDKPYHMYLETIQPDEAVEDADCGAEGTVYSGMFAASRVAAIVNNWGRRVPPRTKEVWNVAFMEHLDAKEVTHGEEEADCEEAHRQADLIDRESQAYDQGYEAGQADAFKVCEVGHEAVKGD